MTIQRYVDQLITDLREVKKRASYMMDKKFSDDEFEQQMEAFETAPDILLSKQIGIKAEELPPFNQLTPEQAKQITDTIEDSLTSWGVNIILPESVPIELRYQLIRNLFDEEMSFIPGWTNNCDFCSGDCPECKIGDYCSTKKEVWGD